LKFLKVNILLTFLLLNFKGFAEYQHEIIRDIENKLQVKIILDTGYVDSWDYIIYKKVSDTFALKKYLKILRAEFSKYPENFFVNIGISTIVIGEDMHYNGQKRAAIPDPYLATVYYEIDPDYETYYYIHTLHHELHHCTEYAIWKDMYFDWDKWTSRNKKKFRYGNGGASTYEGENTKIDWYSFIHPQKGFVNLYSTTGQEEDRCEIVSLIMSDEERKFLFKLSEKDKIIRKKVKLMLELLDNISGTENNFWNEKINR